MPRRGLIMLLVVFAGVNVDLLSACGPSGAVPIQERHCKSDLQCDIGFYCHSQFEGTCQPCTDCSKWKRLQPEPDKCPKAKKDCGVCQPGFEDDGDLHCTPTNKTKILGANKSSKDMSGGHTSKHENPITTWVYIVIGVSAVCIVGYATYCGVGRYKKNKRGRHGSGQSDEMPLKETDHHEPTAPSSSTIPEEYNPPPPYTFIDRIALVNENRQEMARPFCHGTSAGAATNAFLEPEQMVPELEQPAQEPMFEDEPEAAGHFIDVFQDLLEQDPPIDDSLLSEQSIDYSHVPMEDESPTDVAPSAPSLEPDDQPRNETQNLDNIAFIEFSFGLGVTFWADLPTNVASSTCTNPNSSRTSLNDSGVSNSSNTPPYSPGGPHFDDDARVPAIGQETSADTGFNGQRNWGELTTSQVNIAHLNPENAENEDEGIADLRDLLVTFEQFQQGIENDPEEEDLEESMELDVPT